MSSPLSMASNNLRRKLMKSRYGSDMKIVGEKDKQ